MNIEEILKKHVNKDGTLNYEAAAKELREVQGREFVPKADFNSKNEELKSANETLNELKTSNKDIEALQTTISEHETTVQELQKELATERKTFAIKEALQGAGAKDVDYMMYKLGDVEVDENGSIKDLENRVKQLQEENPSFFGTNETKDDKTQPPTGFQVVDNKLEQGKGSKSYSFEELSNLSPEEINENWDAVSETLEKGADE